MFDVMERREAAVRAIRSFGAKLVWFEGFGGRDDDAEDAYLGNVASSDVYLGILGLVMVADSRPATRLRTPSTTRP